MGTFFTNLHVRIDSNNRVVEAVKPLIAARAYVSSSERSWVSIFDERSDDQDEEELAQLALNLSSSLKAPVIAFLVHDSDVFCYWLYRDGECQDKYDSRPDYFGSVAPERREQVAGKPEVLLPYCLPGTDRNVLCATLRQRAPRDSKSAESHSALVFEEGRASSLALLLGINPLRATTSFSAIEEGIANGEDDLLLGGQTRCRLVKADGYADESKRARRLLGAVKRGSLDDVQAILSEGINPRRAGFKEALAQAGQSGNIEILRCFVEAGADVNARFENGSRLLHCAIVSGCATAVKYLVDRGADVGAKNEVLGEPPLFTAMFCGDNAEIAEVLLNGGVEVNRAVDVRFSSSGPLEGGVTPLMCAARFVCPSVVESLLKHGASRTARDASGKVALAYAAEKIGFFERLQKRPDVKNPDWVKAQLDKLTRIVEMISSSRGAH